jgi:hypothetical protein
MSLNYEGNLGYLLGLSTCRVGIPADSTRLNCEFLGRKKERRRQSTSSAGVYDTNFK